MNAPPALVCLSHLRWGFVFQRPNHLAHRFAKDRPTFFVEEPIYEGSTQRMVVHQEPGGVTIVVPHLPEGSSPAQSERAQRVLLDAFLTERHIEDYVLWYWTPMALGFTAHLTPRAVVYDCMDELSGFRGAPPLLTQREQELFDRADVVFTGGVSLYESKKTRHSNVHAFPSSVDAAHYGRARGELAEPADQAHLTGARFGYFGVIDERIDYELLAELADARPHDHVIMVGPVVKVDPAALPQRPNLHWLGGRSYAELPGYVKGWDVALMPFALNESTRFISPTKTLEYLAAGKPVVSTAVADVVRPYGEQGLVRIANRAAFPSAVAATLAEDQTARRAAADAYVAQTSWDRTYLAMRRRVDEAVALNFEAKAAE